MKATDSNEGKDERDANAFALHMFVSFNLALDRQIRSESQTNWPESAKRTVMRRNCRNINFNLPSFAS
jgi:hypothetical protein